MTERLKQLEVFCELLSCSPFISDGGRAGGCRLLSNITGKYECWPAGSLQPNNSFSLSL